MNEYLKKREDDLMMFYTFVSDKKKVISLFPQNSSQTYTFGQITNIV